ncbi:MAG: MBL fold metallo-hydrolase, partial [Lachnospiraceae bacterium]|nr:MBL fold metallo-hydrolase [Lachnospiraceae bacterium]
MMSFAQKVLSAPLGETHLFSVGQAGYIVKSKRGQLFGVDLYLSECVERVEGHMGFKRLLPRILEPNELAFDCLVATHSHVDHLDVDAISDLMSDKTRLYVSVDCEEFLNQRRVPASKVTYVCPGDECVCEDFRLSFIRCDHGDGAPDAVGLILTVDEKCILFVGDTCLHLEWMEEYLSQGAVDVLIAPINGAYGNLNEVECAELSAAVKPGLTIPSHYGMFASHGGDPGLFYRIMTEKYPNRAFCLMCMGE